MAHPRNATMSRSVHSIKGRPSNPFVFIFYKTSPTSARIVDFPASRRRRRPPRGTLTPAYRPPPCKPRTSPRTADLYTHRRPLPTSSRSSPSSADLRLMATAAIKHGVPVVLQELQTSSFFKQHASLRVTGRLQAYSVETAIAVIIEESVKLKIDTQHLRDLSFQIGSIYQFIGELVIQSDNDAILQARVGRNVDGIDLNLYHQSLLLRRQFEAELANSRPL